MDFVYRRRYRGRLKAIILDWAGTTVDYGSYAPAMVFRQVYENEGVPITMDEARAPMGAHKKVHIRKISQLSTVASRWQQAHGRPPIEEDVERMYTGFVPLQLDCLPDYADLIPGTQEAVTDFRQRGLKIGSTTGYTTEMMEILRAEARTRGYEPDSTVCATEVPAGRPEPWMCVQSAMNLRVYPFEACVKVDDTLTGIEAGLNAGMWTVGLVKTGNEMGLSQQEIEALEPEQRQQRLGEGYRRMRQAGAHYVVDGIADVPAVLDSIERRLAAGERP